MKKYRIRPNKKQLKIMKEAWRILMDITEVYYARIRDMEKSLRQVTGIKGIEFIKDQMFGGEWIGIGNLDRTMKLYQREELE